VLLIPIVRLFNPKGPDRVAIVSVQAAWANPGAWNVQVARGPRRAKLSAGVAYGPYPEHELAQRHPAVLASLRGEGFVRAGLTAMLQSLVSNSAVSRAHAAARLGWLGDTTAVPALLLAADNQGTDLSSIVDALGRLGDARAIPLCRAEAARKLLSRRRSGVEALRSLGDAQGLAEATQRAHERLPDAVRLALLAASADDTSAAAVQSVTQHFKSVDVKDVGLAYDTLYEIGTPLAVACALAGVAGANLGAAYTWRYVKSIARRAMLRGDFATFGWVSHRIEKVARKAHGTIATVKSGLDGQTRSVRIFHRATQDFMRRLAWRYLVQLARHRPAHYALAAAEAAAAYQPDDAQPHRGAYDAWARAYLFHRVLRGESKRFEYMARTLAFRTVTGKKAPAQLPGARTEAYPELWDANPLAYVTLLARSKVAEALAFAVAGVQRHPTALHAATHAQVLAALGAPHDEAVALASAELERRFDASAPDWSLVDALVADARPAVRALGQRFLTLTADVWTRDIDRAMAYLAAADAGVRTVVAGLVVASLDDADPWFRRELAERVLAVLQAPESSPGANEGFARVARDGLAQELADVLGVDELMAMVSKGSPAAQAVGATVLGRKPEAVAVLGMARIVAMAQHDVAAVREAARGLLGSTLAALKADPSPLFTLVESEWADTRAFAFDLLRDHVELLSLGVDGYVGLCDSNRDDVQSFGRDVVLRDLDKLDVADLIGRLTQHPAPRIRRFALDLAVGHLREGFIPLAKLENFFRTALFDLWPSRNEKRLVVEFLSKRGLRDERQAEVASRVLGDFVRVKGRRDFENALEALVRIKLAYPEVESRVAPAGAAGGAA
jgi:hypothetical protein